MDLSLWRLLYGITVVCFFFITVESTCNLPDNPQHGSFDILTCVADDKSPLCQKVVGTVAPHNSILEFHCDPGYSIHGRPANPCVHGEWANPHPTCERVKPSCKLPDMPQHGSFIILNCNADDNSPLCQKVVGAMAPDNTILDFHCNVGYNLTGKSSSLCINGTWSNLHPTCESECGKRYMKEKPIMPVNEETKVGEFPWHVVIYKYVNGGNLEQVCGGTLVNPSTVVTAATCFWNESFKKLMDKSLFRVAAGKYYRDWNTKEQQIQERELSDIIVHKDYRGSAGLYRNDIAILKLSESVQFTWAVYPVCLDYDNDYEDIQLVNGNLGTVVGWGITEKNVLATKQLPFVDYGICIDNVPESFRQYITVEKICAGYTNGTSVCSGDAGGSLVFEYQKRYYLRGIISIGAPPENNELCSHTYGSFTKVSYFLKWIKSYL